MTLNRADFRDTVHFAAAVASELAAPALRIASRALVRRGPSSPRSWRSGLILGNGHIGDVLYRTCSLEHLASALPGCRWSYLTTPVAASVLRGNPALTEILPLCDAAPASSLHDRSAVRRRRFDVALCTENTRGYDALMLALRLGIPNRVAFVHKGFTGLTTIGVRLPAPMSRPAQFRRMVEIIADAADPSPLRPRVYPSAADHAHANAEWLRLALHDAELVVACAMTTRQTTGSFPPAFFRDVLERVIALRPGARVLLLGSADDLPVLATTAAAVGRAAVVSAGTLGLRAVVPLLARCSVFFGSDSGPRHLANAANIPVYFVRNMGGSEAESGRYCATEVDVAPPGEYLSGAEMERALAIVDRDAIAWSLVHAAERRVRGIPIDTPL